MDKREVREAAILGGYGSYAILPMLAALVPVSVSVAVVWEEVLKWLVLQKFATGLGDESRGNLHAFLWGWTFGFGEAVLYLMNSSTAADIGVVISRLVFTATMHGLTVLAMFVIGLRSWRARIAGLAVAVGVHASYNLLIG